MRDLRRPRQSLEIGEVVRTALEIVDREGLAALTMRRLAGELDVGVTTLYGYFRTKDELEERIIDLALAELEIPGSGDWGQQLTVLFRNLRDLIGRHPSLAYADAAGPVSGPAALRAADAALGMLRAGGLEDADAVAGMSVLVNYTFGSAMFRRHREVANESRAAYELHIRGADPATLPNVAAMAPHLLNRGTDEEFDTGLSYIVEGLRRQARSSRRRS